MVIKVIMLVVFFGIMIGVGFYARKQATDVNGFVLGGRSVGPWLTAFAYGTSYFSAVIFIGYAGQFGSDIHDKLNKSCVLPDDFPIPEWFPRHIE